MTDAELAANGGGVVAELVQSRDASVAEALAMFRAQFAGLRRRLATHRGYRLATTALCAALVTFFIVLYVGNHLDWFPDIPPLLFGAVAGLFVAGAFRLWRRYYYSICAEMYRECHKANRRVRIAENGVVAMDSSVVSSIRWKAIIDIVVDKDSVVINLSPLQAISFPKAAFESQDVEGFCAELQRRWKQALAATSPST